MFISYSLFFMGGHGNGEFRQGPDEIYLKLWNLANAQSGPEKATKLLSKALSLSEKADATKGKIAKTIAPEKSQQPEQLEDHLL